MSNLASLLFGSIGLVGSIFWFWMLYDCLNSGNSAKRDWLWILLFLNVMGALLYFFSCWLPRNSNYISMPSFVQRWRLGDALRQAEADARNIGNAHQYVKLGNLYLEMGNVEKAAIAFDRALSKEPQNVMGLWGVAQIAIQQKNWEAAKSRLETLLDEEPEFMYGEASLTYGLVIYELKNWDKTIGHLREHTRTWSHPQGYLTLARAYQEKSLFSEACATLETMIDRISSSPPFQYRKYRHFLREGEKLLKLWSKQLK